MKCLRCGTETGDQQVFCKECLSSMEKYPIKPGTPITLPERRAEAEPQRTIRKKREPSPEEQLARANRLVQFLAAALAAALVTAGIFGSLLFVELTSEKPQHPGSRNYSTTEGW